MPWESELTDATLVKLFHLGRTDKEIAKDYGITPQAVSKRRVKLTLRRQEVVDKVAEGLAARWTVFTVPTAESHHSRHSARALKVWLRRRLGDDKLSPAQIKLADQWERNLRRRNAVLCYDPSTKDGWFYRPRTPADGQRVIDWPADLPFPDEQFRRALELPPESEKESV
jgi:hypothetical protein